LIDVFGKKQLTVGTILTENIERYDYFAEAVRGTNTAIEQAIVNTDTNAAKLAQAKNRAHEVAIELGEKLAPAMTTVTGWGTKMLKVITSLVDFFKEYKSGIITVTTAIAAYTLAVKVANSWDKIHSVLLLAKNKILKVVSTSYGLLAGKIKLATIEAKLFNSISKSTLWGALAAGVAILATSIIRFVTLLNGASKAQKEFKNKVVETIAESNSLFEQLKRTNPGTEQRAKLIGIINEKYGSYLKGINLEIAGLSEIEKAQQRVNTKLLENIVLEAKQAEIKEIARIQAKVLLELGEKGVLLSDLTEGEGALKKYVIWADNEIQSLSNAYFQLQQQIDGIATKYDLVAEGIKKSLASGKPLVEPEEVETGDGGDGGKDKTDAALKKLEELKNKTAEIRRQMYLETLSENEKELTVIRDKYDKELMAAGLTLIKINKLRKLAPEKMSNEQKAQWDYYLAVNDEMSAELEVKKQEHLDKMQEDENKYNEERDKAREEISREQFTDMDAEIKATQDKYIRLKELAIQYKLDSAGIVKMQQAEEEAIRQKYRNIQLEKDRELLNQKLDVLKAGSDLIGNLMQLMGERSQKDTAFYKTLGLAQIAIDTGVAVAGGIKTVMTSNTSVSPWEKIAAVIAIAASIIGAIASASKIVKGAEIPNYATGGPTGSGYGYTDDSGYRVAGVVHENEYVIPAWERKLPQVAAMEQIIESIRSSRNGYASGGTVTATNTIYQPQIVTMTDTAMISILDSINKKLDKPTRAKVVYTDLEEMETKVNTWKADFNI
jgi:hypothetical protein